MSIVHETAATVQFDAALRQAAAKATTRYAGESARISRALILALNGAVTLHTDGTATVQSGSDAEVQYAVRCGACECVDAQTYPAGVGGSVDGRCKHRWAKSLVRWALKAVAEEAAPAPRFYSTYYTPGGAMVPGIAEWTERGWLHTPDDGESPNYVALQALALGGRVDLCEKQRALDGNLIDRICGHNGQVTR